MVSKFQKEKISTIKSKTSLRCMMHRMRMVANSNVMLISTPIAWIQTFNKTTEFFSNFYNGE